MKADFLAGDQCCDEGFVLFAIERTIDIVSAGATGPGLEEQLREHGLTLHRAYQALKGLGQVKIQHPAFYRWAVFLVAAVYPTFTYGDDAKKWVGGDEAAGKALRESTNVHRQNLLKQMEAACGAPHFLGRRFSAIDLYLAAMSHWRPGRDWWKANVPKLLAAADAATAKPEVGKVVKRDFK